MTRTWDEVRAEKLAAMSDAERAEYERATEDAELGFRLAEMVYDARKAAGLTQVELAGRMETSQSVISQIEGGSQVPTVAMLARVARATGQKLEITITPAA